MSQAQFRPGQRWVSHTEAELGLGIVAEVADRHVQISFPSAAERRTYAVENAPLGRVIYAVGDCVTTDEGLALQVIDRQETNGCVIYLGVDTSGGEHPVHEMDLDSFVHFSKPQDRLFAGQVEKLSRFELRRLSREYLRRHRQSPACGLLGPRVQLLPHQLYIAAEVASRHAPRVLLADEVGLGKTIEAGLILHQQLFTGRAARVLVLVPDSLLHQWLVELLRRFNLAFTVLDKARCEAFDGGFDTPEFEDVGADGADAENPFESAQLVLSPLSLLVDQDERQLQALAAGWDMLVVDEAHHLDWSEAAASPAYSCVEALARQTPGLLLLTATPEQLGVAGHFARLRLLDPHRFFDLQAFVAEEARYRPVSDLVQALLDDDLAIADQRHRAALGSYLGASASEVLDTVLASDDAECIKACRDQLVRDLLDRHGTGRVLFRNTREAVSGFPQRVLNRHPLLAPPAPDLPPDASLEMLLQPECSNGDWLQSDPRVAWLVEWLLEHRDEKALVICARAGTAQALEEHLRLREGVRSAVFHEDMSLLARDRAAAYFADDQDSAQTLICSEIGSEGRNFQFAQHLILFDLPLNPDLLEQRIGRLDRLGQRHDVQIHVPYHRDSATEVLLLWYHGALNAFESVCPIGLSVYQRFADTLHQMLRAPDMEGLQDLIDTAAGAAGAAREELHRGRDRLLELNSCQPDVADDLIDELIEVEHSGELEDYLLRVFDEFGVEQQHHSADSIVIRPGEHMLVAGLEGLKEEGMAATFSRTRALSREDLQFLSWEHPLVAGLMELIVNGDFGSATVCTLKLPPLKPGTVLLEALFAVHCPAPKALGLSRYLGDTDLRVVVDQSGRDLSDILSAAHLDRLGQRVKQRTAAEMVRHIRDQVDDLIAQVEAIAGAAESRLISGASAAMDIDLRRELTRLKALSEVNPMIREDEIKHREQRLAVANGYLEKASLRLDAIRLAVVV